MKNWIIYADSKGYGLICGECAEKCGEGVREFITRAVVDPDLYSQNCDDCHKNAGDYFHAKFEEAA